MFLPIPEQFSTDRLVASRFRHEDAEEIFYAYASKPEATKFVSWPTHQRIADTRQFLTRTGWKWKEGLEFSFGIRLNNNRLIGSCGIVHEEGKIQFGYIMSPTQWGNGYATELCTKLMKIIRPLPGILSAGTFIDAENTASEKVLLKSGLVVIEKKEKWFRFINQDNQSKDCVLFSLPLKQL